MPRYRITLTQATDDGNLDHDDREEFGECGDGGVAYEYETDARDKEEALDIFHSTIPIACVDDYEWESEEVSTEYTQET